jgi:hypothetical protein
MVKAENPPEGLPGRLGTLCTAACHTRPASLPTTWLLRLLPQLQLGACARSLLKHRLPEGSLHVLQILLHSGTKLQQVQKGAPRAVRKRSRQVDHLLRLACRYSTISLAITTTNSLRTDRHLQPCTAGSTADARACLAVAVGIGQWKVRPHRGVCFWLFPRSYLLRGEFASVNTET